MGTIGGPSTSPKRKRRSRSFQLQIEQALCEQEKGRALTTGFCPHLPALRPGRLQSSCKRLFAKEEESQPQQLTPFFFVEEKVNSKQIG
jgi:hypothetical protein